VRKALRLVDGDERRKRELALQQELEERKEKEVCLGVELYENNHLLFGM
jgi:hypothetical protein